MTDHPTTNNPVTVASNENKNFIAINVQLISPGDASDRLWMSILGMLGSRLGLHFAMILSSISGWKMRIQKAECVRPFDYAHSSLALLLDDLIAQHLHSRPMHFWTEMMFGVVAVVKPCPIIELPVGAHPPGYRFFWVAAIMPVIT